MSPFAAQVQYLLVLLFPLVVGSIPMIKPSCRLSQLEMVQASHQWRTNMLISRLQSGLHAFIHSIDGQHDVSYIWFGDIATHD